MHGHCKIACSRTAKAVLIACRSLVYSAAIYACCCHSARKLVFMLASLGRDDEVHTAVDVPPIAFRTK